MNKIVGAIVIIIVIAGGAYLLMRGKSTTDQTKDSSDSAATSSSQKQTSSLKDLLAAGRSQKCTFTSSDNGANTNGTFYIANGKSRGDLAVSSGSVNSMTHMISDGSTSYVWTDGTTMGYKMMMDVSKQNTTQQNNVDINKDYNFDCGNWSADSSLFTPPTNIQFRDLGASATTPAASSSTSTSANICAGLQEPAKSQCMAALPK